VRHGGSEAFDWPGTPWSCRPTCRPNSVGKDTRCSHRLSLGVLLYRWPPRLAVSCSSSVTISLPIYCNSPVQLNPDLSALSPTSVHGRDLHETRRAAPDGRRVGHLDSGTPKEKRSVRHRVLAQRLFGRHVGDSNQRRCRPVKLSSDTPWPHCDRAGADPFRRVMTLARPSPGSWCDRAGDKEIRGLMSRWTMPCSCAALNPPVARCRSPRSRATPSRRSAISASESPLAGIHYDERAAPSFFAIS